jgi:hypothetical protein
MKSARLPKLLGLIGSYIALFWWAAVFFIEKWQLSGIDGMGAVAALGAPLFCFGFWLSLTGISFPKVGATVDVHSMRGCLATLALGLGWPLYGYLIGWIILGLKSKVRALCASALIILTVLSLPLIVTSPFILFGPGFVAGIIYSGFLLRRLYKSMGVRHKWSIRFAAIGFVAHIFFLGLIWFENRHYVDYTSGLMKFEIRSALPILLLALRIARSHTTSNAPLGYALLAVPFVAALTWTGVGALFGWVVDIVRAWRSDRRLPV